MASDDRHPLYVTLPDVAAPPGNFSHVAITRPAALYFLSGQVPDFGGDEALPSLEAQVHEVFGKVAIILRAQGLSFRDIVQVTAYLIDPEDVPRYKEMRDRLFEDQFPEGVYPASTAVVVQSLGRSDRPAKIELQVIASKECAP